MVDPAAPRRVADGVNVLVQAAVAEKETEISMSGQGTIPSVVADGAKMASGSEATGTGFKVRGFPMWQLMDRFAPHLHHIDLLSLDIEGFEPTFIDTFPWQPNEGGVSVGVLVVEVTMHRREIIDAIHNLTNCGLRYVLDKGDNAFFLNVTWHDALVASASD